MVSLTLKPGTWSAAWSECSSAQTTKAEPSIPPYASYCIVEPTPSALIGHSYPDQRVQVGIGYFLKDKMTLLVGCIKD